MEDSLYGRSLQIEQSCAYNLSDLSFFILLILLFVLFECTGIFFFLVS
jgi:hypothetical protein